MRSIEQIEFLKDHQYDGQLAPYIYTHSSKQKHLSDLSNQMIKLMTRG